jgi:glycerophosphoryl diester phosphodiesterase
MSHRAGGNEAPENTLAALRSAEKAGSRVISITLAKYQCSFL